MSLFCVEFQEAFLGIKTKSAIPYTSNGRFIILLLMLISTFLLQIVFFSSPLIPITFLNKLIYLSVPQTRDPHFAKSTSDPFRWTLILISVYAF